MVKHIQAILRRQPMNCLSVFDRFVGLVLKGLTYMLNLTTQTIKENKEIKVKKNIKKTSA